MAANRALAHHRLAAQLQHGYIIFLRQDLQHIEAHVVPRVLIFSARIAQANDHIHALFSSKPNPSVSFYCSKTPLDLSSSAGLRCRKPDSLLQIRPCISAYLLATHSTQLNYGNIERREDACRARMKPDVVSKPAAFQTKVVILPVQIAVIVSDSRVFTEIECIDIGTPV